MVSLTDHLDAGAEGAVAVDHTVVVLRGLVSSGALSDHRHRGLARQSLPSTWCTEPGGGGSVESSTVYQNPTRDLPPPRTRQLYSRAVGPGRAWRA